MPVLWAGRFLGTPLKEKVSGSDLFMGLCEKHRTLHGNSFTYTLLDFRAVKKQTFKRWTIGTVSAALGLTALWGILKMKNKIKKRK